MRPSEEGHNGYEEQSWSTHIARTLQGHRNLASSFSSTSDSSWCWKEDLPCPGNAERYSLFINCGGNKMSYGGNDYEDDSSSLGPSIFSSDSGKWVRSSTGSFMGNDKANFVASNTLNLSVTGSEYYETAGLAPVSLKYYGICLQKGCYQVKLHFAEIMFSADETFSSVGRHIFDVSIQVH
ncbi:hypothetical protein Ancab_004120 [Ancistrocladus abbreviatus]